MLLGVLAALQQQVCMESNTIFLAFCLLSLIPHAVAGIDRTILAVGIASASDVT